MLNPVKSLVKKIAHLSGKSIVDIEHPLDDPVSYQLSLFNTMNITIFDIGAAIGTVASSYKRLLTANNKDQEFTIHCFEPLPQYFAALDSRFNDSRVICQNIALSNSTGHADFYQGALPFTSSLLPFASENAMGWDEGISLCTELVVSVPTTTLEAYCLEKSISHINIVKIDAQGAEALILDGAMSLLQTQRIDLIYLEVMFQATYQGQSTLLDHMISLNEFGYSLLNIYDVTKSRGNLMQIDALFASKSFLQSRPGASFGQAIK